MWTAIAVLIAIFCALQWLIQWINNAALIKCMMDKRMPPTDEELRANTVWVWKKLLGIKK